MIIGGLIQESDSVTQSKVPYLGDVKGIGWLFRKSEVAKQRAEIIVALVPRIQPYDAEWQEYEQGELVRATVPLFEGPLRRTYRPWDTILPDGKRVYKPLVPGKKRYCPPGTYNDVTSGYLVTPYPLPQQNFYREDCEAGPPSHSRKHPERSFLSHEALPMPELDGRESD
jgi:hypothetical protein